MEDYLLCGEVSQSGNYSVHKGRKRKTIQFVGIQKFEKKWKDLVSESVRLLHTLKHPNILTFLEWYETSLHIWVVTELTDGGSLADIMDQDSPIPLPRLAQFALDLVTGLRYIHSQQLVHCDLQPSKILLDSSGLLKLSDFSMAQSISAASRWTPTALWQGAERCYQELTNSGQKQLDVVKLAVSARHMSTLTVPSPFYAAPELIWEGRCSSASDLWSLGCVFWELATGRCPFLGSNAAELLYAIAHQQVSLPCVETKTVEDVGVNWHAVVDGLLVKTPRERTDWEGLADLICLHDE